MMSLALGIPRNSLFEASDLPGVNTRKKDQLVKQKKAVIILVKMINVALYQATCWAVNLFVGSCHEHSPLSSSITAFKS